MLTAFKRLLVLSVLLLNVFSTPSRAQTNDLGALRSEVDALLQGVTLIARNNSMVLTIWSSQPRYLG